MRFRLLTIFYVLSLIYSCQTGKVLGCCVAHKFKCVTNLLFPTDTPCYNTGNGRAVLVHKPDCRRLNQTIEQQENCPSVSRADSPSFAAPDFEALNMVETNDCHLRIYFRDNQMGCRCIIDREHNCQVIIKSRWQRRIRSMDIIGNCRWEIAGYSM